MPSRLFPRDTFNEAAHFGVARIGRPLTCLVVLFVLSLACAGTGFSQDDGQKASRSERSSGRHILYQKQVFAEDPDSGLRAPYLIVIRSDSSIFVRSGRGAQAIGRALPRPVLMSARRALHEVLPNAYAGPETLDVGYDDESLIFNLTQRIDLLLFLTGVFSLLGTGAFAFVFWRRTRRMRQDRKSRLRSRMYQTQGEELLLQRIARALHDGPIQDLHALHLYVAKEDPVGETQQTELASLKGRLTSIIKELRHLSVNLRPPALEEFSLSVALRSLTKRIERQHPGLSIDLDIDPERESESSITELGIYRIAQESINNAVRHGEASNVRLELKCTSDSQVLVVQDDGGGFHVPSEDFISFGQNGHFGLLGMKERAEELGGRFDITSEPGSGTRVTASIPKAREPFA